MVINLKRMGMVMAFAFMALVASLFVANSTQAASYKEGDILITSSTRFWGFTGHAGIVGRSADGNLYAVHIPGPGKPIQKITLSSWESKYPKTEIWRHNDSKAAEKAGQKSMDFVRYYGTGTAYVAPYSIFSKAGLTYADKSETYCSKLVWQSYYYGPGFNLGFNPSGSGIIAPYSLRGLMNMKKVGGSL